MNFFQTHPLLLVLTQTENLPFQTLVTRLHLQSSLHIMLYCGSLIVPSLQSYHRFIIQPEIKPIHVQHKDKREMRIYFSPNFSTQMNVS